MPPTVLNTFNMNVRASTVQLMSAQIKYDKLCKDTHTQINGNNYRTLLHGL